MALATDRYTLDLRLCLQTPAGNPLEVKAGELTLKLDDDDCIADCSLVFHLSAAAYQQVEQQSLFHLEPELRGPGAENFEPSQSIELEARLTAELLSDWPPEITSADAAAAYLQTISQTQPDHPYFFTESWYGLSVLQAVPLPEGMEGSLKSGYKTHWAELADREAALNDDDEDLEEEELEAEPIFPTLLAFFEEEGWSVEVSEFDCSVKLAYEGENGEWNCLAVVRDETSLCMFYSDLPLEIPPEQLSQIHEFVTRINWGLPIGNFEMDLDGGLVRFKTSLDVEGNSLSFALINQLIYNNLSTMDQYLPGFQQILQAGVSPREAIEQIESPGAAN